MLAQIILTNTDIRAIVEQVRQMASNKDSGQTFEYRFEKRDYCVIMDVTYTFDAKEVRGGSFEYWNGYVEYERCTEITDEQYTIESLSAFYEEEELQVPENLEKLLTEMLNQ